MPKKITLSLLVSVFFFAFVYAADETLTITTYYPSPYGVYKDLRVTENLLLEREPINTDGAQIEWRTSANNAGWHWNIDQYAYDTPLDEPRLRFYIENPTLGTNSEKLTLLQNGNVGIGTLTPEDKLDVNDSLRIRGSRLKLTGYDGANNFWVLDDIYDEAPSPITAPGGPYTINGRTAIRIGYGSANARDAGNEKRKITLMGDVEIGNEQNDGVNPGYSAFKKNLLVTQDLGIGWGARNQLRSTIPAPAGGGYDLVVYHDGAWGKAAAASFTPSSDINLKENITTLEGSLDKIKQLRGVSFSWKNKNSGEGEQMGLIAQEVEKVYPSLVNGEDGNKTLNYDGLIAPLIEAVKEQQEQIDSLKAEISYLKSGSN